MNGTGEKTEIIIAGIKTRFFLRNANTSAYLNRFVRTKAPIAPERELAVIEPGAVDSERLDDESRRLQGNKAFAEYSLLLEEVANLILPYERFFFHGAAFLWRGKAYLFTGQSGVGKTTMLRNWLKLYRNETEIINGDKPIIERNGNRFIVHPSPWTGKEGWNGKRSALLGGIICLEQGKENGFFRMDRRASVFPIFLQFLYKPEDEACVDLICDYERSLIENVPIWKFINEGTVDSAKIAYMMLREENN